LWKLATLAVDPNWSIVRRTISTSFDRALQGRNKI
jgi:hypothetical protein